MQKHAKHAYIKVIILNYIYFALSKFQMITTCLYLGYGCSSCAYAYPLLWNEENDKSVVIPPSDRVWISTEIGDTYIVQREETKGNYSVYATDWYQLETTLPANLFQRPTLSHRQFLYE